MLLAAGGYTVMAGVTTKYVFDLQPGDVYWCTADCGWITGHSYLTYGPLLNGAQNVIFEGVPTYPDPSRCWQIVEKHKVGLASSPSGLQLWSGLYVARSRPSGQALTFVSYAYVLMQM